MKLNPKKICGNWNLGFTLDKHTLSSIYTGHNEFGYATTNWLTNRIDTSTPGLSITSINASDTILAVTNIIGTIVESNMDPVTYLTMFVSNEGTTSIDATVDVLASKVGTQWSNIYNTSGRYGSL